VQLLTRFCANACLHLSQVSEARDAFDFFDNEATGELDPDQLDNVLQRMGLTIDEEQITDLFNRHVLSKRPDATTVTLHEYMHIFSELDELDAGIIMV
jgi:Ca2+-binding EF-hand superfamily protein